MIRVHRLQVPQQCGEYFAPMTDMAVKAPAKKTEYPFVQKLGWTEVAGRNQMKIRKVSERESFFRRHEPDPNMLCGQLLQFNRIILVFLHRSLQKLISNIYYHTVFFNEWRKIQVIFYYNDEPIKFGHG